MVDRHESPSTASGDGSRIDTTRAAVLVHIDDALRRRAWRTFLQPLGLRVLLSGREVEAAKCLADAGLIYVVAVQAPAMRETLRVLRPELPVVWLDATAAADDEAMHAAAARLSSITRRS